MQWLQDIDQTGCGNMGKRSIWNRIMRKKVGKPPKQYVYCCVCGGKKMRQTTLDEFMDITGPLQYKLPIDFDKYEVTEKVGLDSNPRRYRGMI